MEQLGNILRPMLMDLEATFVKNQAMKKISKSITKLTKHLHEKGYDSLFRLGTGNPDKLEKLLNGQLQLAKGNPITNQLSVKARTITGLPDRKGNYTKCEFHIDYDHSNGLHIKGMKIIQLNLDLFRPTVELSIDLGKEAGIPTKAQANKMVGISSMIMHKKKRMKL